MKISIRVFGSDNFLATLPDQIRDESAFLLEVIADINQPLSHHQIGTPDIILVQASLNGSMELCSWLKEQAQLSWIHCILLEDRPQQLAGKNQYGWEWEFEMTANALKQGADAYIWQLPEQRIDHTAAVVTANHRLILAQLAVGWRKAQKYHDLMKTNDLLSTFALADALTEMNNRRALEWDLPKQIKKARTQGNPLSLVILDVDYFKKVNDTYGHLVGDRLLQLLCSCLRENLRFEDTPFRYGGEEFVVVLPKTTSEEAFLVAERLNRVVNKQLFTIDSQLSINITISLGVACLQVDDDELGFSLLNRADKCLLQAKATGRNQAILWEHLSHIPSLEAVSY
jgi:diguanylate cyclase (GGDEF)-like protein